MSSKRNPHSSAEPVSSLVRTILLAAGLLGCFLFTVQGKTITYTADDSDFPNPERGFWGGTVDRKYIDIGSYKNSDLPQSFLDNLENTFKNIRASNKKAVPRFKYTNGSNSDASLERILGHIDQLGPVLARNYDVIAVLEAGFVGLYGEWHSSISVNTTEARRKVLFKLLSVLPKERMVALRYNKHKRAIFDSNQPLTINEAYNESYQARTAAHNDCFLSNDHNSGTYSSAGSNDGWGLGYEAEKQYLSADNLYLSQEGETCGTSGTSFATCDRALTELARMRWDMINAGYYKPILDQWKNQGCYAEISKRLGYRIRLIDGTFDDAVTDGDLNGTLRLTNEGWGKIFNPRKLEMVLRNTADGQEYVLPMSQDPRLWSPGQEITLDIRLPIPQSVPFGNYSLHLKLPDPAPLLYGRPQYSIRLANSGIWDAAKGYNSLQHTVKVSSFSTNVDTRKSAASSEKRFGIRGNKRGPGKKSVEILFANSKTSPVRIDVYNLSGAHIANLVRGNQPAGSYRIVWQGVDDGGRAVLDGVYCVTFRCAGAIEAQKVVLRK